MKIYKLKNKNFLYDNIDYFFKKNIELPIYIGIIIKSKNYNYIINEMEKILSKYKIYYIYSSLYICPQLRFFNKNLYFEIMKNSIKNKNIKIAIIPFTTHIIKNLNKKKYTFILIYNNEMIFNSDNNIKYSDTTLMSIGDRVPSFREIEDCMFAYNMVLKINIEYIIYAYNRHVNHFETMEMLENRYKKKMCYKPISKSCVMAIIDCEFLEECYISMIKKMGVSCLIKPVGNEDDQRILRMVKKKNISMILINKKKKK
ncbi:hypothetical protein, partial [Candidatus Annandia adelgestsuga]|uniref:hypothetical protein n=1 Tax=Candidatus Annandia adelgestsuga TaxID=1302411 RepID=UPI0018E5CCE8